MQLFERLGERSKLQGEPTIDTPTATAEDLVDGNNEYRKRS